MLEVRTTFTVGQKPAWSPGGRSTLCWLAPSWTMLPLAARSCRVRNPLNGMVAELSADQYAVLTACEGCKTLDEHGLGVRRKLGVPDQDWPTISQWLSDFVAVGLLTSLDDLVKRLDANAEWTPASFAGVVIRTSDRPELLARLLQSAAALERRGVSRYRYQVLDDSRDLANVAANRNTVAECGLDCVHHDLSQEHPIAAALRVGFPGASEDIEWLVGRREPGEATYGRPVNLALLLTAGRRALMLDDDAVLDPRLPPLRADGLEVSSRSDELYCFETRAQLEQACPAIAIDPIAAHLETLGMRVGHLWRRHSGDAQGPALTELTGADAGRFAAHARVLVTQNHALGDPGSALFPYHLLTLPAASREQLLGAPGRLSIAFRERYNWRGHARMRLTPNRPLTFTTLAGLDNSALLPPTVRSNRNEDLLLGDIIRYAHPGAWSFDLPWALPHWREPSKHWMQPPALFPQEPVHFLMDYLESRASSIVSSAPADRMRALAAALLDLSRSDEQHISEILEQQAADTASRVRYAIQSQLDDASVAPVWKQILPQWLASPTLAMRPDVLRSRLASPQSVRGIARGYGRALATWPELWEWARQSGLARASV
jgi:hypothetical protein